MSTNLSVVSFKLLLPLSSYKFVCHLNRQLSRNKFLSPSSLESASDTRTASNTKLLVAKLIEILDNILDSYIKPKPKQTTFMIGIRD